MFWWVEFLGQTDPIIITITHFLPQNYYSLLSLSLNSPKSSLLLLFNPFHLTPIIPWSPIHSPKPKLPEIWSSGSPEKFDLSWETSAAAAAIDAGGVEATRFQPPLHHHHLRLQNLHPIESSSPRLHRTQTQTLISITTSTPATTLLRREPCFRLRTITTTTILLLLLRIRTTTLTLGPPAGDTLTLEPWSLNRSLASNIRKPSRFVTTLI